MFKRSIFSTFLLSIVLALPVASSYGQAPSVERVTNLMPSDFAFSLVINNPTAFDKQVLATMKRFDPSKDDDGFVKQLQRQLSFGELVDFTQPVAIAGPNMGSGDRTAIWVRVPDFATKIKTLDLPASEEDGLWQLGAEEGDILFARVRGDYVVASTYKDTLAQACAEGKSLTQAIKPRLGLLGKRQLLMHMEIDAVRGDALGGLAQAAQMAPMLAMMMGQQGGNAAMATAGISSVVDAAKDFMTQVSYVDLFVGITDKAADITVATGYLDGSIKTYLSQQKPASGGFFAKTPDQSFFAAIASEVPGSDSPFFGYLKTKAIAAMEGGIAQGDGANDQTKQLTDAMRSTFEIYEKLEGTWATIGSSGGVLTMSGAYTTSDAPGLLKLVKASLDPSNPLSQQLKGASYESLGVKDIGGASVEQFMLKMDPNNPAAAMSASILGKDARFGLGMQGGAVRFCMGTERLIAQAFSSKGSKPLSSSKYVVEALAALPAKKNAVILVDAAVAMSMFGPMLGAADVGDVAPGPPIAISASLSGEPARLDIHIPFRAVERVMQAMAPESPM